jgi:hypothetical protein
LLLRVGVWRAWRASGLRELWEQGSWREMVGPEGLSAASSPVLQAPALDRSSMAAAGAGVKRGLLEAVMQLSMPREVRAHAAWRAGC